MDRLRIAVIAAQRTGTHALTTALAANGFVPFDEVLATTAANRNPAFRGRFRHFLELEDISASRLACEGDEVVREYLNYLDGLEPRYSIDLKYNTLKRVASPYEDLTAKPIMLRACNRKGFLFVHLVRANAFLRYFSERLGASSGEFHVRQGAEAKIYAPIEIDPAACLNSIRTYHAHIAMVRDWLVGTPHVELTYESTFQDGVISDSAYEAMRKIGIEMAHREPAMRKPERPPERLIRNYAEVRDALIANGYENLIPA